MNVTQLMQDNNQNYKNNFDFLRFLAAMLVAYSHSFDLVQQKVVDPIAFITNGAYGASYLGVILFFCISGYLVTKSVISSKSGIEFLLKRLLRLFPAYAVVVLLCLFVLGPMVSSIPIKEYFKDTTTWDYLWSLDFVHLKNQLPGVFASNSYPNTINGSLWTLVFEVTCYCILFVGALLKCVQIPKQIFRWIMLAFVVVFIGFKRTIIPGHFLWSYMDYNYLVIFGSYFFVGACIYCFQEHIIFNRTYAIGAALLFILSCYYSYFNPLNIFTYLCIPYITIYIALSKGRLNNFGKYGDYSYGMYLYAFPVQQILILLFNNSIHPYLLFVLTLIITIPLAIASWHFIEKPALRLKKYISFDFLKSKMEKSHVLPSTIEVWPYVLVAFLMPIEFTPIANIGFAIWGSAILYFYFRNHRWSLNRCGGDFFFYFSPLLIYALVFVGLVTCSVDDCLKISLSFMERQALFALYPLLFFFIPKFSEHNLQVILNWFSISLIIQLFLIFLVPNYEPVHHPYLGMYSSFSIACCLHLFFRQKSFFHLELAVFLFVLLIIIKAKTAITISLLLIGILSLIHRKFYLILIVIFVGVSSVFSIAMNQGTFSFKEYLNGAYYVKTFSWECSWQAFVNSGQYWLGVGVGNSEKVLNDVYHTYPDWVGYMGYNSHNQYLETLLAQGIIGLSLLLFWYFQLLKKTLKQRNSRLLFFMLVIILASFTESILWRQKGVVFLVYFSILLSKYNPSNKENRSK